MGSHSVPAASHQSPIHSAFYNSVYKLPQFSLSISGFQLSCSWV